MKAVVFELPSPEDMEEGRWERVLVDLHRLLAHLSPDQTRMVTSYRGRPGLMLRLPKEDLVAECGRVRLLLEAEGFEYVEHVYYQEPRSMPVPPEGLKPEAAPVLSPKKRRRELRRLLESARAFYRLNLFGEARTQFQEAHTLDPLCAEALFGLSQLEVREGRDETAERLLRRALDLDPEEASYHHALGGLLHRHGRLEEAEGAMKAAVAREPREPLFFSFLGWIYLEQGDTTRASLAFREALELAPDLPAALSGLGSTLMAEGHLEEGQILLDQAVAEDPTDLVPRLQRGWCRFHLGDLERAEADFLQVHHGNLESLRSPAALGLGRLYLQRGSLPLAIDHLRRCTGPDRAQADVALGEALFLSGRYEEAQEELERALEASPEQALDLETRLALCALRRGHLDEAESRVRRALGHQGPRAPILELLGALHGSRGDWDQAREALEQACFLEPDSAPAFFQLGWIEENLEHPDRARQCYLKALRLDPRSLEASLNLGWLYLDEGRPGEAAVVFEAALEDHPEDPELLYSLGRVLYREERFDRAVDHLHRSLLLQPERADTRAWLGAALCSAGRAEEGRRELRQALRQGPDEETACFIRRQLRQRTSRPAPRVGGLAARTRKKDRLPSAS